MTAAVSIGDATFYSVRSRDVVPGMVWHGHVIERVLAQPDGVRFCVAQSGEPQCRLWRASIAADAMVDVQLLGPSAQRVGGDDPIDRRFRIWPAPMTDQVGAWTWDEEQGRYLAYTTTAGPESLPTEPRKLWAHPGQILASLPSIYPRDVMLRDAFLAPAVPT